MSGGTSNFNFHTTDMQILYVNYVFRDTAQYNNGI